MVNVTIAPLERSSCAQSMTPTRRDPAVNSIDMSSGQITLLKHWLQRDLTAHDERIGR